MKRLILPFFIFTLFLFFPINNSLAACITEGEQGCSANGISTQGDCCSGLICAGLPGPMGSGIANGTCQNPSSTTPVTPKPKSVVRCQASGKTCSTNDDCCSKICAIDNVNRVAGMGGQSKCFDVEPTWPQAQCAAPNEACGKDSDCCYGTCIEQGGGKICMEGAPSSNNPPPCSEWQDGKCIRIASGLGIDIPTDVPGIIKTFFGIILSIAGATATLLFIYAGYKIMSARGNPEKFQEAKDRFTSTILGLLFIILSLVILQVIGVDLLKIPGFSQ